MKSILIHHNNIIENISSFLSAFSISDLINFIGIGVNAFLAYWIVKNLQDRINNKRVLKDHFINETKELRVEYRLFMNNLYLGKIRAKEILPWFKLMNIKCNDILSILNSKHKVKKNTLKPYTKDLKKIVTEFEVFIENYQIDGLIELDEESKTKLIKFQQQNIHIFNKLIIEINDN